MNESRVYGREGWQIEDKEDRAIIEMRGPDGHELTEEQMEELTRAFEHIKREHDKKKRKREEEKKEKGNNCQQQEQIMREYRKSEPEPAWPAGFWRERGVFGPLKNPLTIGFTGIERF